MATNGIRFVKYFAKLYQVVQEVKREKRHIHAYKYADLQAHFVLRNDVTRETMYV